MHSDKRVFLRRCDAHSRLVLLLIVVLWRQTLVVQSGDVKTVVGYVRGTLKFLRGTKCVRDKSNIGVRLCFGAQCFPPNGTALRELSTYAGQKTTNFVPDILDFSIKFDEIDVETGLPTEKTIAGDLWTAIFDCAVAGKTRRYINKAITARDEFKMLARMYAKQNTKSYLRIEFPPECPSYIPLMMQLGNKTETEGFSPGPFPINLSEIANGMFSNRSPDIFFYMYTSEQHNGKLHWMHHISIVTEL